MTSKTNFINYFLLAFTLAFISSGLSAGTLDFKDKKKDKEKKEELTGLHKEFDIIFNEVKQPTVHTYCISLTAKSE